MSLRTYKVTVVVSGLFFTKISFIIEKRKVYEYTHG